METELGANDAEAAALTAFVEAEGGRLIEYAFLLTRNPHEAQDLVQTVLYRLTRRGILTLDNPVSYARRCLINEYRSNLRRIKARIKTLSRLQPNEESQIPDHSVQVASTRTTIAALAALTPRQREAVVLRYYGDLSIDEIATTLSCAPGTVRSLLSRAMPVLRNTLEQMETER